MPRVVLLAPTDVQLDLRRQLSSIEYEIVAAVSSLDEIGEINADVVALWEPDAETIAGARERGLKTVAIGGPEGADLHLSIESARDFRTRVWELFRPA